MRGGKFVINWQDDADVAQQMWKKGSLPPS
jgi:hypothetical protein